MSYFYINCITRGNNLLLTYGYGNEVRYVKIPNFKPTLFYEARGQDTGYRELVSGIPLMPQQFDSIRDANKAIQEARDIEGLSIYGNRNFHHVFLHQNFANMETSFNEDMIRGFFLDIECPAEIGFPCPGKAEWAINLMGIYDTFTKKYRIWGENAYDVDRYKQKLIDEGVDPDDVIYYEIKDEYDRLEHMLNWWNENCPAYITGWNTSKFDNPYLVNRLMKLGLNPNLLSPWGVATVREREFMGKPEFDANILGVADLDYMDLYKKNRFKVRESYRLDFIAHIELKKQKVDYSEVAKNLRTLHKKDWDLYTVYNVMDIALVKQLDEKFGYLSITFAVAYAAGINFNDVSSPVATWEQIIYRDTIDKGIVLPPKKNNDKVNYEGGYVKYPQTGKHRWVCSFDLNSLYPHLIMGSNISPETITPIVVPDANVESILEGAKTGKRHWAPPNDNVSVCASGNTFRNDIRGVMGYEMERLYKERKAIKREMLGHEQDVEDIKAGRITPELMDKYGVSSDKLLAAAERQESRKDGGQLVRKILLNSAYGALANVHFCLFDIRLAESITKQGQLSIRWAGEWVNKNLNEILGTNEDYIIYTDTDSIYVNMDPVVKRAGLDPKSDTKDPEEIKKIVKFLDDYCEQKMQPIIDEGYAELQRHCNSYAQKMVMAREVISDNSIFCAKKRYAMSVWNSEGVAYDEAEIKTIGLDVVKSSTPEVVRDAMKDTIKMILNDTEANTQKFIKGFKAKFKEQDPEDIAFPRGVNKVEESYCNLAGKSENAQVRLYSTYTEGKTVPINSRAAIIYNLAIRELGLTDYQKILPADKIKFIHIEQPNRLNSDVVGFPDVLPPEFKVHNKIDYDTMFEKTYLKPMRDIMELIGWSEKPVATLESFFSSN